MTQTREWTLGEDQLHQPSEATRKRELAPGDNHVEQVCLGGGGGNGLPVSHYGIGHVERKHE